MPDHKEQRMWACADFMDQCETMGNDIHDSMINRDEMYHCKPESKQQSVEWQWRDLPIKKMFKAHPSTGKVMCSIFRTREGLSLWISWIGGMRSILLTMQWH
jgi:hypothetical protein